MRRAHVGPRERARILELASRPEGLRPIECAHIVDIDRNTARRRMREYARDGLIIAAYGGYNGRHLRYFTEQRDADVYTATKRAHSPRLVEGGGLLPRGQMPARVQATVGIATGCDPRFQLTPEQREALRGKGEFSRLRVGEYPE